MRKIRMLAIFTAFIMMVSFLGGCVSNTPAVERAVSISYVSDPKGLGTDSTVLVESAMDEIGEYYNFKKEIYDVSDLDDVKGVAQKAVKDGANLYIGTSYAVNYELLSAFEDKPNTKLAMIGTRVDTDKNNVVSITFKMEEAAFLAGYMAASVSTSGVVGYIGGFDSDYEEQHVGFYAGAKYKNPDITVVSAYTDSYNSSAKGKEAANSLKAQNADVLYLNCGSCALGITELFRGSEVKLILSDIYTVQSDEIIAQSKKYIKNAALYVIDEYLNNELYSGEYRYGVSYGFVDLQINKADNELKNELSDLRSKIRTSALKIPFSMDEADMFLKENAL
ncbi:MAG: BMP family ABC transporter substrate-binding protein [Anaerofustis stercorihominis]|nr:BMP family ABC transporter substrate-binding protein [Anaerofustis stercorihominis]